MEPNEVDENGDYRVPKTCDMQEALMMKLEELDSKIAKLVESNLYLLDEIKTETNKETIHEYQAYIRENEKIIGNRKGDVSKILSAFIKAKLDIDKIVLPKLKNRHLYLPAEMLNTEEKKEELVEEGIYITRPVAHTATTFESAVAE